LGFIFLTSGKRGRAYRNVRMLELEQGRSLDKPGSCSQRGIGRRNRSAPLFLVGGQEELSS
jgi:hypothetical protein